jgi:hypothetical protein
MQVNELYNQYAYEGYEELVSTDESSWEVIEGQDPVLIAAYTPNQTANEYKTGVIQTGAGQTTVVATGGVTINGTPGLKLRAQWSGATLIKRATDTWALIGDLSA